MSKLGDKYKAYFPDSHANFGQHGEFDELHALWIQDNEWDNGGDVPRLIALMLNVKKAMADGVQGAFAEVGTYKGNSAAVLAHYARKHDRMLYLFDTFEGVNIKPSEALKETEGIEFNDTSLDAVKSLVGTDHVGYNIGFFPYSIPPGFENLRFAVVHLDADLYEPQKAGLEFFYPRLSPGGLMIVHDYYSGSFEGCNRAVDEFVKATGANLILMPDKSGTAIFRKSAYEKPTPESYLKLSVDYYQAKQFENSIASARKALELRPGYVQAYINLCAAENALGRFAEGKKAGDEALRLDPNNQLAKNNLQWSVDGVNKK